eukprot:Ihof_evm2s391 gene=Ihof_evmTU2s391
MSDSAGMLQSVQQAVFDKVQDLLVFFPDSTTQLASALTAEGSVNTIKTAFTQTNKLSSSTATVSDKEGNSLSSSPASKPSIIEEGAHERYGPPGHGRRGAVMAMVVGLSAVFLYILSTGALRPAQRQQATEEWLAKASQAQAILTSSDYTQVVDEVKMTYSKMQELVTTPIHTMWSQLILRHESVQVDKRGQISSMSVIMAGFVSLMVGSYMVFRIKILPDIPRYRFVRLMRSTQLWVVMLVLGMVLLMRKSTGPVGQAIYLASPLLLTHSVACLFTYFYDWSYAWPLRRLAKLLRYSTQAMDSPAAELPHRSDFALWQPLKRRELGNPVFAGVHALIMLVDYGWLRLDGVSLLCTLISNTAVVAAAWVHYDMYPGTSLVYLLVAATHHLLGLSVSVLERLQDRSSRPAPIWPYALLLGACCQLLVAAYSIHEDVHEPLVLSGGLLFSFTFIYVLLVLIQPSAGRCHFGHIVTHMGEWLRTPAGSVAIGFYMFVYSCMYAFSVITTVETLLPLSVFSLILGAIIMPVNTSWALCVHAPLGLFMLLASLRLNNLPVPWLLSILRQYLPAPLLAQVEIVLDVHYTSAVTGLAYLSLALVHLFTCMWQTYLDINRGHIRTGFGIIHMASFYTAGLMIVGVAQHEKSMVHLLESLCAGAALVFAMHPCLPLVLNVASAKDLMRKAVPLDRLQDVAKGKFDMDEYMEELQETGMKTIKQEARDAVKKKSTHGVSREPSDDPTLDLPVEPSSGLFVRNPSPMPLSCIILLAMGLRLTVVFHDNVVGYAVGLILSGMACMNLYLITRWVVLGFLSHAIMLVVAASSAARLMALWSLGGVYLMTHVLVVRYQLPPSIYAALGTCFLGGDGRQASRGMGSMAVLLSCLEEETSETTSQLWEAAIVSKAWFTLGLLAYDSLCYDHSKHCDMMGSLPLTCPHTLAHQGIVRFNSPKGKDTINLIARKKSYHYIHYMSPTSMENTGQPGIVLMVKGTTVTPPEEDIYIQAFAAEGIQARVVPGLNCTSCNLHVLHDLLTKDTCSDLYSAIIVTSPRAVDSLRLALPRPQPCLFALPIYVVGPATAAAVKQLGFSDVRGEEAGTGLALSEVIAKDYWAGPETRHLQAGKPLLHLHGDKRRNELPTSLQASNIPLSSLLVYETLANPDLSDILTTTVGTTRIDWVVFFSPSGVTAAMSAVK